MRPIDREPPDNVDRDAWVEALALHVKDYDSVFDRMHEAQLRVNELTRSRDQLQAELNSVIAQIPGVQATADSTRGRMAQLLPQLDDYRAARDAATARLLGTDRLAGMVETKHPLLLLPVRLETRFVSTRDGTGTELWVRVYPDDVHIDTHEPGLTAEEERWGKHFWAQVSAAPSGGDHIERKQQAWRQLVDRFGSPRAAWIARVLDPARPLTIPPRESAWTRAPHTQVLPDRWVAIGYREEKAIVTAWGKPIRNVLATGPSPQPSEVSGTDQLPAIDAGMRWMIDFEAAETIGMALRIPLTEEQASCGFERLVVIGIKASLDAATMAARLADLLDAQHYTNGLALVPQNVPTNNTSEASSGYKDDSSDAAGSYAIELGDSLTRAGSDGELAAHALGIPPSVFSHVRDADGTEQAHARGMNTALWGISDSPLTRQLLAAIAPNFVRDHFIDFVRARGPLPACRVGSQPYGLLPVAALDRWVTLDAISEETALADWWRTRRQAWRRYAARALSLAQQETPLTLLGQEASSCHYVLRELKDGTPALSDPRSLVTASLRDLLLNHGIRNAPAFDFLKTLPDAVRQALLAETLDLVTYRFDAWATSLAARRLAKLRRSNPNGIRAGGYGWVEDLRRQPPLQEVSPLPASTTGPLYRSEANKGYVQAPSLTHAATAAVLRSGYLSHQQESGDSPFAIDLSSDRVRRAKWLLDGVRQGQPLAAFARLPSRARSARTRTRPLYSPVPDTRELEEEDALAQAYDEVRKAEQLATEVSSLYAQRDQANQRARDLRELKKELEERQPDLPERNRYDR